MQYARDENRSIKKFPITVSTINCMIKGIIPINPMYILMMAAECVRLSFHTSVKYIMSIHRA